MRTEGIRAILIVCVLIVGAVPLAQVAGDRVDTIGPDSRDADNNGDFATADPVYSDDITLNGDLTGVGDPLDFYKIQLNNSGGGNGERLIVNATANGNGAIKLNIFDPDTYWIVTDLTFGQTSYLEVVPEWSGWYYVSIEGQGMTFPYSIRFQKMSVPWSGDANTDATNATVMSAFPYEVTSVSYHNRSDPQDFYKVHLDKVAGDHTDIIMVKFTPPADPDKAIPEMYYASNHTGIQGMSLQKGASWVIPPAGNIFTFAADGAGDYLIRTWGYEGQSNYDLKVLKVTANVDTNNDQGSAEAIMDAGAVHTDSASGVVAQSVDELDYFSFQGKKGMHINVTLESTDYDASMALPTIYITLYNSTGFEFAEADLDVYKWSADPFAYIEGDLPKNDTYYIEAKALGGAGNYDIDLTANTPPQVVADWLDQDFEMFIWENGMNDSLDLDHVFMDFDGDTMVYSSDADLNPYMGVSIDAGTSKATFTPVSNFKGPTCVNFTAWDTEGGKGFAKVCTMVYGVNHVPFIGTQFNETYPNSVLGMKYGQVKTIDLAQYFDDIDDIDKHWYSVQGNDLIDIYFAEEMPLTPDHYHTGIITVVAPSEEVVESVQFHCKDNGWPMMTSVALNLTIMVSSGVVKVESKPGGQLTLKEDNNTVFKVKDYIYFKPPPPPDDTIEYSEMSSDNLTVTIVDGVANITPKADWCGIEDVVFYGDAVKNKASNSTTVKVVVNCVNDPPVLASTQPTGTVTLDEGGSLDLIINVTDIDTDPEVIKYMWFVDGVQQPSVTRIFTYMPGYDASGLHNISVTYNDTEFGGEHIWVGIEVKEVNRLPQNVRIIEPNPNENVTVKKGKLVTFKAGTASDPDGDHLTYTWYDGAEVMDVNQTFDHKFKKKGDHVIKLEVSDGHGGIVSLEMPVKVKAEKKNGPGFEAAVLVAALAVAVMLVGRRRRR